MAGDEASFGSRPGKAASEAETIFLAWAEAKERDEALGVEELLTQHPRHAETLAWMISEYEHSLQIQTRRDVTRGGGLG